MLDKYVLIYYNEHGDKEVVGGMNINTRKDEAHPFSLEKAIEHLFIPMNIKYAMQNKFMGACIRPIIDKEKEEYGSPVKVYRLTWKEIV
ncbi:hypothetical protein GF336_04800 [Candidatus Woesearchaeota archaeon]|nr:hypothetical protein [Candidatus Woesearchaeota archaeon]